MHGNGNLYDPPKRGGLETIGVVSNVVYGGMLGFGTHDSGCGEGERNQARFRTGSHMMDHFLFFQRPNLQPTCTMVRTLSRGRAGYGCP
jgi:hypothetical protein